MNAKCFDIGVIQTFVDGELGSARAEELVRHFSLCDECTNLVAELESENELAFGVLDQEFNVLVPTERLRTKVFASINEIESVKSTGLWHKISAAIGLTGLAARPGVAAFATVLLFAAFAAVGFRVMNQSGPGVSDDIASAVDRVPLEATAIDQSPAAEAPVAVVSEPVAAPEGDIVLDSPVSNDTSNAPVRAIRASHRPESGATRARTSPRPVRSNSQPAQPPLSPELDAEDGYLMTIATLNRTVNENKDYVLRPSERVAFERDLAVVDDAIKKMKGEVRQNPHNTAAREVLRSSYKSKIDLLSSVADRAETVASLD